MVAPETGRLLISTSYLNFCQRYQVLKLAFFGSVLREDLAESSHPPLARGARFATSGATGSWKWKS